VQYNFLLGETFARDKNSLTWSSTNVSTTYASVNGWVFNSFTTVDLTKIGLF